MSTVSAAVKKQGKGKWNIKKKKKKLKKQVEYQPSCLGSQAIY